MMTENMPLTESPTEPMTAPVTAPITQAMTLAQRMGEGPLPVAEASGTPCNWRMR